jgi:hypothetical protein
MLYFVGDEEIRRIENGKLVTVAGQKDARDKLYETDEPRKMYIRGFDHWLAQGPDDTLYLAGYDSIFGVRSISPDGRVKKIAGGGSSELPEVEDAREACIGGFIGLAVDAQGVVYIAESGNTGGCFERGAGILARNRSGHR